MTVAAGCIADTVIKVVSAAIQAQLGNLPSLVGSAVKVKFIGMLRESTMSVASASASSQQTDSRVVLDRDTKILLMFRLEKC